MKIAIFFENQQIQGGAFNYALNILNIFKRNEFQDYQVVLITENKKNYEFFNNKGIEVKLIENNFFVKAYNFLINIKWVKKIFLRFKIYSNLERFLKSENINLIVFPTGSNVPFSLLKTNFVTTLLDICHLEYSLFPEINDDNNFDDKEFFINNCIPKSIFTFTVSNELKHQVEQFYPFLKNKLTVVPLSLNHFDYQKTEEIKNIKEENFIFYPAHYSAHKNHISLLKALKYLKENTDRKVKVVFCGHDKGNLGYLNKISNDFGLNDQVVFNRFETKENVNNYYKNCSAVIFLSLFGPVNIPPLEAWHYKKPLISNINFKKQLNNSAILVDPLDYKSIAEGIIKLDDHNLIENLIKEGENNLNEITKEEEQSALEILEKIKDFKIKRELWSTNEDK